MPIHKRLGRPVSQILCYEEPTENRADGRRLMMPRPFRRRERALVELVGAKYEVKTSMHC